ncbi:MAG: alpha/beta fold hydrolase [Dehalococcoidia bacterium]|nr:alpha/beta fold hydrolase [Dehalococcoidia bacterium]
MPFVRAGDIDIYYELEGEGPRVLNISGTGGDLRRRPSLASLLGEGFTVLSYDQRGLGQTSIPDGPYSMAGYAADAAALLDALGWERCMVMGTSFGGMVAQEFAVTYPERVERLVLNCTSSGGAGNPSYPLHELQDLEPETRMRTQIRLSDTRVTPEWERENVSELEALLDQRRKMAAIGADEPRRELGARLQLEARVHHDVYDRLPALTMPVLVCAGAYDGIAPPANSRAIVARIPDARYEEFEGGHGFFWQDPCAAEVITAFLRGEAD